MGQTIKITLKIILVLFIGLFLMSLRPSLAMSLQQSPIPAFANYYLSEFTAFGIALIFLVITILIAGRRHYSAFGFSLPTDFRPFKPLILAFLAGAISTLLGSLLHLEAPQVLGDMTFIQVIVSIWIMASIYEELVVRGFIQGALELIGRDKINFRIRILSFPVIISGLFFGLSHLALLTVGAAPLFVIIVVVFAVIVGLLAAYYREKTGSLIPAILIHMVANIAGTAAGYLFE